MDPSFQLALHPLSQVEVNALLDTPGIHSCTDVVPDVVLHAARQWLLGGGDWFWAAPCLIVEEKTRQVLGSASFMEADAPEENSVELGYGILGHWQGKGVASQAVGLMLQRAYARQADVVVIARTAATNVASQRVLIKNGFVVWGGGHHPEEGPLVIWRHVSR